MDTDKIERAAYDPFMYSTFQGGSEEGYICNPGLALGANIENTNNPQLLLKLNDYWQKRFDIKQKYNNTDEVLIARSLV